MDANTKATPDYASIQKASNALQTLIANKKNEMATTKNQLDDYDGFLDKINAAALINENSIEGTISARLYKVDEKTKYIMDNARATLQGRSDSTPATRPARNPAKMHPIEFPQFRHL